MRSDAEDLIAHLRKDFMEYAHFIIVGRESILAQKLEPADDKTLNYNWVKLAESIQLIGRKNNLSSLIAPEVIFSPPEKLSRYAQRVYSRTNHDGGNIITFADVTSSEIAHSGVMLASPHPAVVLQMLRDYELPFPSPL